MLSLVTPPTAEPVSLAAAKLHLCVDHEGDETLIASLIVAARELVEAFTGRALVTQTWRLDLDAFPACDGPIDLKKPPVASVTSIQYVAPDGTLTTLGGSAYRLLAEAGPRAVEAAVLPVFGAAWPGTRDEANAVRVTFVAGYGGASAVPAAVQAALLLLLGDLYAFREAQSTVKIETNPTVDRLLGAYRATWLGV